MSRKAVWKVFQLFARLFNAEMTRVDKVSLSCFCLDVKVFAVENKLRVHLHPGTIAPSLLLPRDLVFKSTLFSFSLRLISEEAKHEEAAAG